MLCVETIAKIRRRHFREGESISAIARDLNLSRATVRKYLKDDQIQSGYKRTIQPKPKLGEFQALLEAWLLKESYLPRRQRRTARRLFEGLVSEGYTGAYDSVQRFVQHWKQSGIATTTTRKTFIPMHFPAGDTCQFDWSYEQAELAGVMQTVKVAHFRLAHSRKPFVVAYLRETQEMVLDAHNQAFAFFGGVPKRMVYDNLKTVVDHILDGKDRQFNRRFMAMAAHYMFEPVACTPASGWEKGQVENQVGNIREWLFTPCPRFDSLAALNHWLHMRCHELAKRRHPTWSDYSIADIFELELPHLHAVTQPFDGFIQYILRVSSMCLITLDRNRYSVPASYAGKVVNVHLYADKIRIVHDEEVIAEHQRRFGRDQLVCDLWHYLPLAEVKPGAIRHGVPFQELPAPILAVRDKILRQPKGDRAFVELLLMVREHGLEPLQVACELALQYGVLSAAIVMNEVRRLVDPPPPAPMTTGQWHLVHEPVANCSRYDDLLGDSYVH